MQAGIDRIAEWLDAGVRDGEHADLHLARFFATLMERLDRRERDAARHAERVASLAADVAIALGLPERDLREIRLGALLHDVGKLAVPDEILRSPGPLTPLEWATMRRHPEAGERILAPLLAAAGVTRASARGVLAIVRSHHERWDGAGYPDGLAGDGIPLGARVVAVADAFEAMLEHRPYRQPRARADAVSEMADEASRQFDPECVASLLAVVRRRYANVLELHGRRAHAR